MCVHTSPYIPHTHPGGTHTAPWSTHTSLKVPHAPLWGAHAAPRGAHAAPRMLTPLSRCPLPTPECPRCSLGCPSCTPMFPLHPSGCPPPSLGAHSTSPPVSREAGSEFRVHVMNPQELHHCRISPWVGSVGFPWDCDLSTAENHHWIGNVTPCLASPKAALGKITITAQRGAGDADTPANC